ncbi:MAG: 4Fe-4S binding protein [Clostridia bacterium]|nr:4Fe-4S binding protein [Clostridia bacterium]
MKKILARLKSLIPTKRRLIQLYAALLFNANIKGFFNGKLYKGPVKNICTPGLNCYSCPGASGACPLGSLQNALAESNKRAPYYVFGIIILWGILFGRFICGWLCPFGLIQDLLYKIKTPKLKKSRVTKILSCLKYVILVFFVFVVPIMYSFRNFPLPAFCKYICPAGTLEGAIGLLSNAVNESRLSLLGPLFTWKFALLCSFVLGCIFVYRLFCRFICPLGALYGLFNRISVLGIKLEKPKCIDCGLCISTCKMDIREVGDRECISCGDCVAVCPTKAISYKGGKIILPDNEIPTPADGAEDREAVLASYEKREKNKKLLRRIIAAVLAVSLSVALVYFNFIDREKTVSPPPSGDGELEYGYLVGELCYGYDVPLLNKDGYTGESFNPAENHGKITVINFWGTWCGPCKAELPYFDRIAREYADTVTVIAVSTSYDGAQTAPEYVGENFADSPILWGRDKVLEDAAGSDYYYTLLGGESMYPMTVVLDTNGVIVYSDVKPLDYDGLRAIIDSVPLE